MTFKLASCRKLFKCSREVRFSEAQKYRSRMLHSTVVIDFFINTVLVYPFFEVSKIEISTDPFKIILIFNRFLRKFKTDLKINFLKANYGLNNYFL